MACLLSPSAITLKHNPKFLYSSPLNLKNLRFLSNTNRFTTHPTTSLTCNAFLDNINIPENLKETLHLDQIPLFRSGLLQFERITEDLTETQKWGFLVLAGLTWIYLTARPGVLVGAIDSYLLAPLKLGLGSLTGRRRLKRTDFVIGDKLGEGSFGVVYSGAVLPKNASDVEEPVQRRGKGKANKLDASSKQKVILKKVKVGVQGAEECADFEEWFNYRLSRAAPETCAEFLGSFVADKTNKQFTEGGKWHRGWQMAGLEI